MTENTTEARMTVTDAMAALGVTTKMALADKLGITRQALTSWREEIPKVREKQIRDMTEAKGPSA